MMIRASRELSGESVRHADCIRRKARVDLARSSLLPASLNSYAAYSSMRLLRFLACKHNSAYAAKIFYFGGKRNNMTLPAARRKHLTFLL